MLNKKDRMKKSKLSSTVLDYYHKYGQNRDLEKYLRTRRSTSKSSSDSSSKNYTGSDLTGDGKRIAKSMEKLDLSGRKAEFDEKDERKASKSAENLDDSGKKANDNQKPAEQNQSIKIEKKSHQQWKGKSKSKSYNFNLESSIEIKLPVSTPLPTFSAMTPPIDSISKATQVLQLESSETQTEPFQMKPSVPSVPPTSAGQALSTPAAVERKFDRTKPTPENVQETSPASSVASAIVRLEWDSMADIGYNRIIDFKSQSNSNLTTFEKSALTKFFAKRGLNFDENLVILAPTDSKSPLQRREFTQSAIEMRDAQKLKTEFSKLTPTSNKRLWEKALQKYREKYGKSGAETASDVDTTHFLAPHHSTPLPGHISGQLDDEHSIKLPQKPVSERRKEQGIEKWCQTSMIDVEAIGIQVEQPQVAQTSRSVQIEIGRPYSF